MPLNDNFKIEAFKQETSSVYLHLLTIEYGEEVLRFVDNTEDVVIDPTGENIVYTAYPFSINLPKQSDEVPNSSLQISNIDREIMKVVQSISSEPTIHIEIIEASNPSEVLRGPFSFNITNVSFDMNTINFDLTFEDVLNLAFPEGVFNPKDFPGIF